MLCGVAHSPSDWIQLLERRGFDPSQLNTSQMGEQFLWTTVF